MIQLDSPVFEVVIASLGWTLLHFLWQGAVIGVLFGISLACAPRGGARTRYRIGLFYLAALAALPIATFFWLYPGTGPAVATAEVAAPFTVDAASAAAAADWRGYVDPYLPWTVLVWLFGVLLMTARLLLEWREVRRLTRLDVEPLSPEWRARVARLRDRLDVHRAVLVLRSARVQVPIVIGWLRPVILVPVSAFTGLTAWQLELILMHELAHVRRHDYLVNLLQVVVETLLFYHPVVRWVSRVVREEREHCCDDLVVARSGDALNYAGALAELAGAQSMKLQTGVGSDGGKLLVRIKRLVLAHEPRRVSTHWSVGAMLAAFGMSVSSLLQPGAQRMIEPEPPPVLAESDMSLAPISIDTEPIQALRDFVQGATPIELPAPILAYPEAEQGAGTVVVPAAEAPAAAEGRPALAGGIAAPEPSTASGAGPALAVAATNPPAQSAASIAQPVSSRVPAASEPQAGGSAQAPMEAVPSATASRAVRPVSGRAPEFPVDARLDGIEGWVKFTYTIARDGVVRKVQIVDAKPRNVFESAVRKAVRGWRFDPVTVDGVAAEREVTQTIEFSLGRATTEEEVCQTTGTRLCRID